MQFYECVACVRVSLSFVFISARAGGCACVLPVALTVSREKELREYRGTKMLVVARPSSLFPVLSFRGVTHSALPFVVVFVQACCRTNSGGDSYFVLASLFEEAEVTFCLAVLFFFQTKSCSSAHVWVGEYCRVLKVLVTPAHGRVARPIDIQIEAACATVRMHNCYQVQSHEYIGVESAQADREKTIYDTVVIETLQFHPHSIGGGDDVDHANDEDPNAGEEHEPTYVHPHSPALPCAVASSMCNVESGSCATLLDVCVFISLRPCACCVGCAPSWWVAGPIEFCAFPATTFMSPRCLQPQKGEPRCCVSCYSFDCLQKLVIASTAVAANQVAGLKVLSRLRILSCLTAVVSSRSQTTKSLRTCMFLAPMMKLLMKKTNMLKTSEALARGGPAQVRVHLRHNAAGRC